MSKCKVCRGEFQKRSMTHKCCSATCAAEFALTERIKNARKAHRLALLAIKPRSQWLKEAQAAFNRWIRLRDANEPCISCGRIANRYDAGHYRSRWAHPELAFEPLNCHKQCSRPCNKDQGGNIVEYRKALLVKLGAERLAWLEGPHEPKKYTIDDLKSIKAKYSKLAKELA